MQSDGLRVLLISDTEADRAAAAVAVEVGSWQDTVASPGLAHFLEHMVFMGSEAYPTENAFEEYIAASGGMSNAYTASERTVYYLAVALPPLSSSPPITHGDSNSNSSGVLEGALARFAPFFISPLLNKSAVARELLAVDSEHQKNLLSDDWRAEAVLKASGAANPQHPFSRFNTGNISTLQHDGIAQEVRDLFARYYTTASAMRLVLLDRLSIPELQAMVLKYFSEIPNTPRDPAALVQGYGEQQAFPLPPLPPAKGGEDSNLNPLLQTYGVARAPTEHSQHRHLFPPGFFHPTAISIVMIPSAFSPIS